MKKDKRSSLNLSMTEPAQRYFVILQLGIFLGTMVFLLYIITDTVSDVMDKAYFMGVRSSDLTFLFDRMNEEMMKRIVILFMASFLVNVLLGLFFLHRITGPLKRVRLIIEDLAKGKYPERSFAVRSKDFPVGLGKALGKLIAHLQK